MEIIIDASVIIASIVDEPEKDIIIHLTEDCDLVAPASVHWEVGNAFSAMLKKKTITIREIKKAIQLYSDIPIRFIDVDIEASLQLTHTFNIYAYDAYIICCAMRHKRPLISLDKQLVSIAKKLNVKILEV